MKVFSKIKLSSTEVDNSIFIDSHWFSMTDHLEKSEEMELVDKIKTMPFLDRKDMSFTFNEISHYFDHDYVMIRKFMYAMTLLKNASGVQLYKFDSRNGIAGIRLVGDIKDFIFNYDNTDTKLETVIEKEKTDEATTGDVEAIIDIDETKSEEIVSEVETIGTTEEVEVSAEEITSETVTESLEVTTETETTVEVSSETVTESLEEASKKPKVTAKKK